MKDYTVVFEVEARDESHAQRKARVMARNFEGRVYGPGKGPAPPMGTECLIVYEGENFGKGIVSGWFSANHYTHAKHIPFDYKHCCALFVHVVPTPPPPPKPDDPFHWKLIV